MAVQPALIAACRPSLNGHFGVAIRSVMTYPSLTSYNDIEKIRFQTLREEVDLQALCCLEVGALNKPMLLKADSNVIYVDCMDTDSLRHQYLDNPNLDLADIVDVDAVWGERTLAECVEGRKFDLVIASHVAEHVPDLVGWLAEVRDVLLPTGELRTVWPDCRFSFDALRRETGLTDILTNYLIRARRPTVANVLDFRLHNAQSMDGHGRYRGTCRVGDVLPTHPFRLALDSASWARDQPDCYFDVHCWVFQPRSFAAIMSRLAQEGLVKFACSQLIDPTMPGLEFFAYLRPCDDPGRAAESWRAAAAAAADPLPGSAEARAANADLMGVARIENELMEARAAVEAMRRSTSWRLTAPLRKLSVQLRSTR